MASGQLIWGLWIDTWILQLLTALNQRGTKLNNIFVNNLVFSLTEAAGDQTDGETAMKNLESARVQMVEKIKSISDFIEREIENENSKKVK